MSHLLHLPDHNRWLGMRGERAAARYLTRHHWNILQRNWRTKGGEIDIVAIKNGTIAFVEVKTRRATIAHLFRPIDAITAEKERRMIRAARRFLSFHGAHLRRSRVKRVRYDVITVEAGALRMKTHHLPGVIEWSEAELIQNTRRLSR